MNKKDNNNIVTKCEQLYLSSKKRLDGGRDATLTDEVVVALWKTVEDLQKKNLDLQKLIMNQQEEMVDYYYKTETSDTNITMATKTLH
jgi:hypothetical protein